MRRIGSFFALLFCFVVGLPALLAAQSPYGYFTSHTNGQTVSNPNITITWVGCYNSSPITYQTRVNNVLLSTTQSNGLPCPDYTFGKNYSASATLVNGANTLYLKICRHSDCGETSITVNYLAPGISVTPDNATAPPLPHRTSSSYNFTVANTGGLNATANFSQSCTGSLGSCSVSPSSASIAAGASTTVTVSYTGATVGSGQATVTATYSEYPGVTDNGVVNVEVTENPIWGVSVTPRNPTQSVTAGTANFIFDVANTSQYTSSLSTFNLSTAVSGSVSSCSQPSPGSLTLYPGDPPSPVSVSCTISGSGSSGSVTMNASTNSPATFSGSGTTNVTVGPTYNVSLTAVNSKTEPARTTSDFVAFTISNNSQNSGPILFSFDRACTGVTTCGDPIGSVTVAEGASATVNFPYNVSLNGTDGEISLTATSVAPSQTKTVSIHTTPDYALSVTSAASQTLPAGSSSGSTPFTITNTSANAAVDLVANLASTCTPVLSSCSPSQAQVTLAQGASSNTSVTYNVNPPGTGTVSLSASSVSPSVPAVSDTTVVTVAAASPSYSVSVTPINSSVILPAQAASGTNVFTIQNTSQNSGGPITFTLNAICTGIVSCASPQGTITLAEGSSGSKTVDYTVGVTGVTGSISLVASSASPSVPPDTGTTTVNATPWYSIAVVPATGSRAVTAGSSNTYDVTIQNQSKNSANNVTVRLVSPTCSGATIASCSAPSDSAVIAQGAQTPPITVTYTAGAAGPVPEVITLTPSGTVPGGTVQPTNGSLSVTVTGSQSQSLSIVRRNPGTTLDKRSCLTVAAGQNAAYECGDLRVIHELPATATMDRERAPALIYNSRHANPSALLATDVTYSGATTPTSLKASVVVQGQVNIDKDFPWNSACAANPCRIVVPIESAQPTGLYPVTLKVKAMNGSAAIDSASVSDTVVIVNRAASPFGAGWWVEGLETLLDLGGAKKLWIGGDGSTRVYTQTADPNVFTVTPAYERPDTLRKMQNDQGWQRSLGDGAYVEFNASLQHVMTVNSLDWATKFFYSGIGSNALLDSLVLPVPSGSSAIRSYRFSYNAGLLDNIQAPSAALSRTTTIARDGASRISSITDPDGLATMFGYDGLNRITSRRNKLADTTYFDYDNGGALKQSKLSTARTDGGGSAIITMFRAAETRSTFDGADLPTPQSAAYAKIDGPRTDVGDTTTIFVNRWGSPDSVTNALGQRTRMSRESAAFPAVVTKVVTPGGFETRAFFNSRALIDSTVAVNPFGSGSNAVTRYVWNSVWNRADSVIDPMGRRTRTFYSAVRPIVDSVRTGANVARRVKFTYTADNQLRSVTEAGGVPDSITYDSFGNAEKTWTPLGRSSSSQYFTQLHKDAIGRDTLVKYPISGDTTGTIQIMYDVADRVIRTINSGPSRPYSLPLSSFTPDPVAIDALTKSDSSGYDAEGNLTFKSSLGSPSSSDVQVNESLVYDAAGRLRRRLIGSGPDSMVYDPAGNLVSARYRSGMWVTQSFDALNRLATRITPEVVHGREQCNNFEPGQPLIDLGTNCHVVFPYYPNSGTSLLIPADTARFVYDAVTGEMREANNRYARVRRSYYPGGALKTDSTAIGLYSSPSVDGVTRGQQHAYDISGRRTSMDWHLGSSSYQYNDFGGLELIIDPNTKQYRITYDLKGQIDSLILASGAKEKRTYDNDGRLSSKNRISTVGTVGTLVSDALGYDKMNRVISVTEQVQQQQSEQTRFSYDGLGGVLAKESVNGLAGRVEEFRNDGFGNVIHRLTRRTAGLVNDAPFAMLYSPVGEMTSAFAQVSSPAGQNERRDQLLQDFASGGQLLRQEQTIKNPNNSNTVEFQSAARHYYGADDRLMAVERYSYRSLSVLDGTWEDYWYDALGRRVLTHARRELGDTPPVSYAYKLCTGSIQCRSFTERVWWDGDNSLVEERTPEGANTDASNSGLIGNIYGITLDEPLAVIGSEPTRIINYNWRGQGMSSVFTDGSAGDISLGNTSTEVDWPASTQAETYFARSPDATSSNNAKRWLGTFVANGHGTTGMLYRRNRYFDPKSGQFTQADPIGIAGGMNAFGFASGDPVNFTDPFGLCLVCRNELSSRTIDEELKFQQALTSRDRVVLASMGIVAGSTSLTVMAGTSSLLNAVSIGSGVAPAVLKGRIPDAIPANLPQQIAMNAAKAGEGATRIMGQMADAPRLIANYGRGEWVKMQSVLTGTQGNIVTHWFRNLATEQNVEYKFSHIAIPYR